VVILLHLPQRNQKMFQLLYIKNKKSRKKEKQSTESSWHLELPSSIFTVVAR